MIKIKELLFYLFGMNCSWARSYPGICLGYDLVIITPYNELIVALGGFPMLSSGSCVMGLKSL